MHACKPNTYGSLLTVVWVLKLEQYLICEVLRGAAGPNVERRKTSVRIKAAACKNTDLQLQTSTFHPANDAAADEDPVKESDDSMETLTYSCLLLFGGETRWTLTS